MAITTTPLPPPPPQQATPPHETTTSTPTTQEPQTSALDLPDFALIFKFNERVFNLEQEVDFEKEAQAEQDRFIDIIDKTVKELVKDEVKGQLNKILPKKIADFATPMIERNVANSYERVVLAKSASQPKSTYEAAASLIEFEFKNILHDKMDESESYRSDQEHIYLYDCLAKSYKLDKDLFETYGKEAEPSQEPKSKSSKSTGSSKGPTQSPCKSFGKSAHAKESRQDSGEPHDQYFVTGNTDEQPADEAISKDAWWKKPEKPLTLDHDWNKR
ncbi:hypothetical protein Tco_0988504 [Tanacetum coccineum]|uniref:Uncharacterized protein n=1 Tax=Tanacetum coccineum TaxID=301880 RepID=A0ABQ5ERA1_9ASTR